MSAEAKIREALAAGPTPGPWTASNRGSYGIGVGDEGSVYGPDGEDTGAEFVKPIGHQPTIRGELWYRDAAYVAACNPAAMTELLADLDRLRAEVEGLRAVLARGYSGGTMVSDFYGPKVTLRYDTESNAEAAFDALTDIIDAIRALSGSKGQGSV